MMLPRASRSEAFVSMAKSSSALRWREDMSMKVSGSKVMVLSSPSAHTRTAPFLSRKSSMDLKPRNCARASWSARFRPQRNCPSGSSQPDTMRPRRNGLARSTDSLVIGIIAGPKASVRSVLLSGMKPARTMPPSTTGMSMSGRSMTLGPMRSVRRFSMTLFSSFESKPAAFSWARTGFTSGPPFSVMAGSMPFRRANLALKASDAVIFCAGSRPISMLMNWARSSGIGTGL